MLCGEVGDGDVSKLDQTKVACSARFYVFTILRSGPSVSPFANCLFFL